MRWHPAFALLLLAALGMVACVVVSLTLGDTPAELVFRVVAVGLLLVALFASKECL